MIKYIIDSAVKYEKTYKPKKTYQGFHRKIRIDDVLFFCKKCTSVWSNVAPFIDAARWRKYPDGNIPSYGKKRSTCPDCRP